jgi:plastocyanin domain-containing protein
MMIINLLGLALIGFIIWWFWLYKPQNAIKQSDDGKITILVENGVYNPARVQVAANKPTELTFIRKDASPCASTVVFGDLDISAELPKDKPYVVKLPALAAGEYAFTCSMQMYRGALIVD